MGQEKVAVPVASVRSVLVLGGARSGKSAYAQSLRGGGGGANGSEKLYLATAEPALMRKWRRAIARHQADQGDGWTTLEEPLKGPQALRSLALARPAGVVLVDCLTLWLSNMMLAGRDPAGRDRPARRDTVAAAGTQRFWFQTEIGLGIVRRREAAVIFVTGMARRTARSPGPATRRVFMASRSSGPIETRPGPQACD